MFKLTHYRFVEQPFTFVTRFRRRLLCLQKMQIKTATLASGGYPDGENEDLPIGNGYANGRVRKGFGVPI